jgi:hypothetical protein
MLIRIFQIVEWYTWKIDLSRLFYKISYIAKKSNSILIAFFQNGVFLFTFK